MSKSRKNKRPRAAPKLSISESEGAALNRAFYGADPADYFSRRIEHVVTCMNSSDAEDRKVERTIMLGAKPMTIPSIDKEPADEDAYQAFIIIECEAIRHHLAETLLRMYFAHSNRHPCPWIQISELRLPDAFKGQVKKFAGTANRDKSRQEIGIVFYGSDKPENSVLRADLWESTIDNVRDFLLVAASFMLDESGTYNAVKHGLAVQAGDSGIQIGDDADPALAADGPSIASLEIQTKGDFKTALVMNSWLSFERELSVAFVHLRLLRALWEIGRARYLNHDVSVKNLFVPTAGVHATRRLDTDGIATSLEIKSMGFPPEIFCPPGAGADALRSDGSES